MTLTGEDFGQEFLTMPGHKTIARKRAAPPVKLLAKSPTGMAGLDEITEGGFPTGRPTLICGSAAVRSLGFDLQGLESIGESLLTSSTACF